jgi:hypothetical protein
VRTPGSLVAWFAIPSHRIVNVGRINDLVEFVFRKIIGESFGDLDPAKEDRGIGLNPAHSQTVVEEPDYAFLLFLSRKGGIVPRGSKSFQFFASDALKCLDVMLGTQLSSCLAKIVVSLATVEGLKFSCSFAARNLETASSNDVATSLSGSALGRFLCSASSKSRSTARRVSLARSHARVFALLWETII